MAKVIIDEPINDLNTSWENYTGQRVEDLIKQYLGKHDRDKIGYMLLPRSPDASDNFYHIKCFASKEAYELWNKDQESNSYLLLFDLAIPLTEDKGTTYAARIKTDPSIIPSAPIVSITKNYEVPIMFQGTITSNGVTENYGNIGKITIQRSVNEGNTWTEVGTTTLPSMDTDSTNYTMINIGQYFSTTNPQQIRLRASYTVTDDDGNIIDTPQSAWLTFSNITYTTLDISYQGDLSIPFNAESGIFRFPYSINGSVQKTVYIKISKPGNTYKNFEIPIGSQQYSTDVWTFEVPRDSDDEGVFSHGVHTIEAYVTCIDGSGNTIKSDTAINQFLVINPKTQGADLHKTWFWIQDVKTTVTNYVSVPEFFKYSVWSPSVSDPFTPTTESVPVSILLTDYAPGNTWTTEYFKLEQEAVSKQLYTLPITVEIESTKSEDINCHLRIFDKNQENFLPDRSDYQILVDNSQNFSPTSGAHFFLNPKLRNNTESNPKTIINAMTGEPVSAEFQNFDAISDLWVTSSDDNQKVLRIKAGQKLTINYDWLAPFKTNDSSNVTFELDFKVKNVTNEEDPIISALFELASGFIGVKMYPMNGLIRSRSKVETSSQDFRWQEGERTHISINIVSSLKATSSSVGTPLCRVFINGVINREFIFGTKTNPDDANSPYKIAERDWAESNKTSKIILGQENADLDIYSIRCYQDKVLSSSDILKNYISTLPTSEEKLKIRHDNDILGSSSTISADLLMNKGKNVLIWHGEQPRNGKDTVNPGWWEIHQYKDDGTEDLEHSGTICKETKCLKPTRQGTTANTYYYSNIQTKLKDVTKKEENKIFIPLDKVHKDYKYKEENVITENGVRGIRDYDGWFDGNGLYHGPYFQIDDSCVPGQKMVLKINYASCMQSHLMGGCKMYNDLHTRIVGQNSLQKANSKSRVAKFQSPFHYFVQEDGESEAVYQGPGTFGPGKMDDLTWGYNKKTFPNFCMMEGADNNRPLTDFRVPWNRKYIGYKEKDGEIEGIVYNKVTSLDLDKYTPETREMFIVTEVKDSNGTVTGYNEEYKTLDAPNETVIDAIKNFVNFLYLHNPKIDVFNGSFEDFKNAFNQGTTIKTDYLYWCTQGNQAGFLKRYDDFEKEWIDAGWDDDLNSKKIEDGVVQRNLKEECSEIFERYQGKYDEINKAIITYITDDAYNKLGNYANVKSLLFHYAFVNQFLAGTDNCSKNTYYVLDPVTLKWEMHQDDVDTIFATDNSGFQTKPYYIDRQNPYPENSLDSCYEGGNNVLFNLIEATYERRGEIKAMMKNIFGEMVKLMEGDTIYTHTPWGALQKYFFSTQKYFSATAYNEAARIRYEYPSAIGFISTRNVAPITQSMGDQLQSELQYMKRRLVLFASYAAWGSDFSGEQTSGNLGLSDTSSKFGIQATKEGENDKPKVVYLLTPHQYIYPTGSYGTTTATLGKRCLPGEPVSFTVTDNVQGDDQISLYAINYYRNIGNLKDLPFKPDYAFKINASRLTEFTVDGPNPRFKAASIEINAPLIEKFTLKNSNIGGSLDLSRSTRLKTIDVTGTSFTNVVFPETSSLTKITLPGTITRISLNKLPGITLSSTNDTSCLSIKSLENLTEVSISGMSSKFNSYAFLTKIKNSGAALYRVFIDLGTNKWTISDSVLLDYLATIENCDLRGDIEVNVDGVITFEKKRQYVAKWGDIDSVDNGLRITYPGNEDRHKIDGMEIKGQKLLYENGVYSYDINPTRFINVNGNISILPAPNANDFTDISWSFSGYGADDGSNFINSRTGVLTVTKVGDRESEDFNGTITCTVTKKDGTYVQGEFTVHLNYRHARVGDYVFADGSYSDELSPNKTVVGVCFYVNKDKPKERLAVGTKSLGTYAWGMYQTNLTGLSLYYASDLPSDSYSSGLSTNEYYDLKNLPNITGSGLLTSTGSNSSTINADTYWDSSKEEVKDYKKLVEPLKNNGDKYFDGTRSEPGLAAAMIGYVGLSKNLPVDEQVCLDLYPDDSSKYMNQNGEFFIKENTRLPWGFIQTQYIIQHRNHILNHVITNLGNRDDGKPEDFGLPIPKDGAVVEIKDEGVTQTVVQTESNNLNYLMNQVQIKFNNNANYSQLYYPAASICYAYDPSQEFDLKPGETLSPKLSLHHWFLPSSGDLARIYWYHRQCQTNLAESEIIPGQDFFRPALDAQVLQSFPSVDYLWTSVETGTSTAVRLTFQGNLDVPPQYGIRKEWLHIVYPVVAF